MGILRCLEHGLRREEFNRHLYEECPNRHLAASLPDFRVFAVPASTLKGGNAALSSASSAFTHLWISRFMC